MIKGKNLLNQELLQNDKVENLHFSPAFCRYFLNNWCIISPLWTSFHLNDQSKHGCTKLYKDWWTLNAEKPCVKSPLKSQGILKFYHKSTKHMVLSSGKERM